MVTIFNLKYRVMNDCKVYFGSDIFRKVLFDKNDNTCDAVLNSHATLIYSGDIVTIDFKDLTMCIETTDFHYVAIS